MNSSTGSEVALRAQTSSAVEQLSTVDLKVREKFNGDLALVGESLLLRQSVEESLVLPSMGFFGSLTPVAALLWAPLLNADFGASMLAGLGTAVILGIVGIPPISRFVSRGKKMRRAWIRWAIEDLKNRSGIELNHQELGLLNYPVTDSKEDRIIGSIDKFFPGEGVSKVTLIREDGQLKLLKGEAVSPELTD